MASGELARIRRGVYGLKRGDVRADHHELIAATTPLLAPGTVVSHTSAAVLHGLPVQRTLLGRLWVIRGDSNGGTRRILTASDASLREDEIVEIDGIRVTSLARTVVDLARTRPFDWGVVAADSALRLGLSRDAMDWALDSARGFPGVRRARTVVGLADARAESPGESRSRAVMFLKGVPAPELQFEISCNGAFVARTDFAWPQFRTVGEFDGRVKYTGELSQGQAAEQVLFEEKQREQRLRDAGWWFVRWGWRDLAHPEDLARRLSRAFELAPMAA